jgi:hypothetical protein
MKDKILNIITDLIDKKSSIEETVNKLVDVSKQREIFLLLKAMQMEKEQQFKIDSFQKYDNEIELAILKGVSSIVGLIDRHVNE